MRKPAEMFDRDFEWSELIRFVTHVEPRAALGVVSGRRRQGKTFLLDAVTRATGGFMFSATESIEVESLRQFGAALATHVGESTPFRFT
ncbi:MAG TPA: ATP-binding protein, partial [Micromonospora sp.]